MEPNFATGCRGFDSLQVRHSSPIDTGINPRPIHDATGKLDGRTPVGRALLVLLVCRTTVRRRRETLDTRHGIETLVEREDAMETMALHHSQVNGVADRQGRARCHDVFCQQPVSLTDREHIVDDREQRIEGGLDRIAAPNGSITLQNFLECLRDGRVLAVGGIGATMNDLGSAEVWTSETDSWARLPSLSQTRFSQSAAVLDDGRVLLVGGIVGGTIARSTVIFDPIRDAFAAGPPTRFAHARRARLSCATAESSVFQRGHEPGDLLPSDLDGSRLPSAGAPNCVVALDATGWRWEPAPAPRSAPFIGKGRGALPDAVDSAPLGCVFAYGTVIGLLRELSPPLQPARTGVSVYVHEPDGTLCSVQVVEVTEPSQAGPAA
jgi:hypothetical protein